MSIYIPCIKKVLYTNNAFVERSFPALGKLNVSVGTKVEPFSKLGLSKVSYKVMEICPQDLLIKSSKWKESFYTGDKIGRISSKVVIAPFDGKLLLENGKYFLKEEEKVYWLLAGVWGQVVNVLEEKSVLLKTQVLDIHFVACTPNAISGELVVFPNPSDVLEMQYLEKFEKYAFGKIMYVGNYANAEVLEKAANLGVAGIVAGSADKVSFTIAKKHGVFLGVFSGFGKSQTPKFIFDSLKDVSNRYVFIYGENNILRVPIPANYALVKRERATSNGGYAHLKFVKKGLTVQVLQDPYFGMTGVIDSIKGSSIFIKLIDSNEIVDVLLPNIIAVEF